MVIRILIMGERVTNSLDVSNSKIEDIVYGDKNILPHELHPLEKAIKSIQEQMADTPELEGIIEELAEYITDRPDREIIGVEAKLKNGNREDLIQNAVYYKNKFERKIAKKQLSNAEQYIYAQVLSYIESYFNQYIRPLILNGSSKEVIDSAVQKYIYEPVHKAVIGFDISITMQHVSGMLFFLTGKCHLVWGK